MHKLVGITAALGAGFLLGPLYLAAGLLAVGYIVGQERGRAQMLGEHSTHSAGALPPGPIAVLCGFLRNDREPPPYVVHHAIAEAELIGRRDLAHNLARTWPNHRDFDHRDFSIGQRRQIIDVPAVEIYRKPAVTSATQPASAQHDAPAQQSNNGAGGTDDTDSTDSYAPQDNATQAPDDGSQDAASPPSSDAMPAADPPASPLPGVSSGAWSEYRERLARESPTFDSARHVGRYRARKDRLRDLGLDPAMLTAHPRATDLQDHALAIDAVDNAHHLAASGTVDAYVGRTITIPDDPDVHEVTLSGLVGVAQVAGLEGAIGWLEHKEDRRRFPHTTSAFKRTNGVF